jgi:hypothetical protein
VKKDGGETLRLEASCRKAGCSTDAPPKKGQGHDAGHPSVGAQQCSLAPLDIPACIAFAPATAAANVPTQTHLGGNVLDVLAPLLLKEWVGQAVLEHRSGKLHSSPDCGASLGSVQRLLLGQVRKEAEELFDNTSVHVQVAM